MDLKTFCLSDALIDATKYVNYIKNDIDQTKALFLKIGIKKVIFNNPATIIVWCDKTKTVVKCGKNDIYDPEKGLAMAIAKKALGNKGNYYNVIKKWCEPQWEMMKGE